MLKAHLASLLLLGLTLTAPALQAQPLTGQPQRLPLDARVTLGKKTFKLEVARTNEQKAIGLMFRTEMPADQGMVFLFEPAQPTGFWMRNTLIPLDMIFVHRGRVVYIAQDVPPCRTQFCPTYGPPGYGTLVDQVIELNAGTTAALALRQGDRVQVEFLGNRAFPPQK